MEPKTLITALATLKQYLPDAYLIPCDNKKMPAGGYLGANGDHWITPDDLGKALQKGELILPCWYDWKKKDKKIPKNVFKHIAGFKVLTGKRISYQCQEVCLVAIDQDGTNAKEMLESLITLPKTVAWTSGKEDRATYLFYVPASKINEISSKRWEAEGLEFIAGWPGVVVPPSAHPTHGQYEFLKGCGFDQCKIAPLPDDFLKLVKVKPKIKKLEDIPVPTDDAVPLFNCICPTSYRDLIQIGCPPGSGHNNTARDLLAVLIGTEDYLTRIGQPFTGSAEELYRDFLAASGLDPDGGRELQRLKISESKSFDCVEDAVNNCIRGYVWTNILKREQYQQGKLDLSTEVSTTDLWSELLDLYQQASNIKEEEITKQKLAAKYKVAQKEVERLYKQVAKNQELVIESDLAKQNFVEYIKIKSSEVFIDQILPPELAHSLIENAHAKYHPSRILTYIWPAIATIVGAKVKIAVNEPSGWYSDLCFYCVDIGRKGSGKSAAGKDILSWLKERDTKSYRQREMLLQQLGQIKAQWDSYTSEQKEFYSDDANHNPELFAETIEEATKYIFDSPTIPAVIKYLGAQESWKSGLLYNDELAALFAGFNQYNSKGGNDRQFWLEFFNGRIFKTLERVADVPGVTRRLNGQMMNVAGAMQHDAFQRYLGLASAQDGLTDRFLICNPREIEPPSTLPQTGEEYSKVLWKCFDNLNRLEFRIGEDGDIDPQIVGWHPDAYQYWNRVYTTLQKVSYELRTKNPDFSGYCMKLITYYPRLCAALSLLWQANYIQDGELFFVEPIFLHIAEKSWALIQYHATQYLSIQYAGEESRDPIFQKVWEIVQAEGGISPRDLVHRMGHIKYKGGKITSKIATDILYQLSEMGVGRIEKIRRSVRLVYEKLPEEMIADTIFSGFKDT